MSQLDLAVRSGFSSRHVSFIETGRTQASRHALLTIAESLDIPLRERNRLLASAGYAHVYGHTPLDAAEMDHVRGVLDFVLERHKPYPAVVHDRYLTCLFANDAAARLVEALVDPSLLGEHMNFLRITFHPLGARRWIVNWDDVAHHLLSRAERDFGAGANDPAALALLEEIRGYAGDVTARKAAGTPSRDLLLPLHIRTGAVEMRLFSMLMTLGSPQDVTLQELRIETFFPADDSSERAWQAMSIRPPT